MCLQGALLKSGRKGEYFKIGIQLEWSNDNLGQTALGSNPDSATHYYMSLGKSLLIEMTQPYSQSSWESPIE